MGYTTDFIGHIDVFPPLNEQEQQYLTAFAKTRRYARPGGAYDVPPNPAADNLEEESRDTEPHNRVADGQPGLWCDWVPCWDGCCFAHSGVEKFYDSTAWMRYLIEHFLKPGAYASESQQPCFDGFTFDHSAEGIVAGCRRDNKELFLIVVEDNLVTEQILRPGDSTLELRELLAYEKYKDSQSASPRRRRRGKRGPTKDNIVSLYGDT